MINKITKHDLPLFDLSVDRIIKKYAHYIDLKESYILYYIEVLVDKQEQPNSELESEKAGGKRYICSKHMILRSDIIGVEVYFDRSDKGAEWDVWITELLFAGCSTKIIIKYETQEEANKMYEVLFYYIINTK